MIEHGRDPEGADAHRQGCSGLSTTLHLLSGPPQLSSVECRLTYSVEDPFAVRLDLFPAAGPCTTWTVGRDLLSAGTEGLSGGGAFKVWPSRGLDGIPLLYLRLEGKQGIAVFAADRPVVRQWLNDTYAMVPAGTEAALLDWTALTESLLPPV
jgi:hypothetical protein